MGYSASLQLCILHVVHAGFPTEAKATKSDTQPPVGNIVGASIAGIVLGLPVLGVVLVVVLFCLYKWRQR